MELINQSDYYCNQCEKHATEVGNNFILLNDNLNKTKKKLYLCPKCCIKAVLMVRPIEFDKEFILSWLKHKLEEDTESCAQEGMSNEQWGSHCAKLIDWLSPFLESK